MGQNLVDAAPQHDVAAQEQPHRLLPGLVQPRRRPACLQAMHKHAPDRTQRDAAPSLEKCPPPMHGPKIGRGRLCRVEGG
ncbi:hypothetical protein, partial [Frateuria sp.]|uniref:hypothetical protein n=1 Tax=Frateuria sp. TaxID=2211372 RepID=UPI0025C39747